MTNKEIERFARGWNPASSSSTWEMCAQAKRLDPLGAALLFAAIIESTGHDPEARSRIMGLLRTHRNAQPGTPREPA